MRLWVRILELPIAYFHDDILRYIAKPLGRYLKTDDATLAADRGKFARIAVEINVSNKVIGEIIVDGKWYKLEYEDLPKEFYSYRKSGHRSEHPTTSPVSLAPPLSPATGGSSVPKRQEPTEKTITNPVSKTIACQPKGFSPWPWVKVEDLESATDGITPTVKVVESKVVLQKGGANLSYTLVAECLVGDETGAILFFARKDQVDLMKAGETVILRNAKIEMLNGFMRLAVNEWGCIEVTEPAAFEVNKDNNLSLLEYEEVDDSDEE